VTTDQEGGGGVFFHTISPLYGPAEQMAACAAARILTPAGPGW
jgi:hypothetical protein